MLKNKSRLSVQPAFHDCDDHCYVVTPSADMDIPDRLRVRVVSRTKSVLIATAGSDFGSL